MKRLWRPICVWLLGHDWEYCFMMPGGRPWMFIPIGQVVEALSAGGMFQHMHCKRCNDRIG